MSRTVKQHIESPEPWRIAKSRNLTPYVADKDRGSMKYRLTKKKSRWGKPIKITKTDKLVTKNANRSYKKAMRQQSQEIIREALNK